MHSTSVGGRFAPSLFPLALVGGLDENSPLAITPATSAMNEHTHGDEQFVWQQLLDSQQEHLTALYNANTESVVSDSVNTQNQNRFPWESLCTTTMKEVMGAECYRLTMEGDCDRHMQQYIEIDNLINSPGNVVPKIVKGPFILQTKITALLHQYQDLLHSVAKYLLNSTPS